MKILMFLLLLPALSWAQDAPIKYEEKTIDQLLDLSIDKDRKVANTASKEIESRISNRKLKLATKELHQNLLQRLLYKDVEFNLFYNYLQLIMRLEDRDKLLPYASDALLKQVECTEGEFNKSRVTLLGRLKINKDLFEEIHKDIILQCNNPQVVRAWIELIDRLPVSFLKQMGDEWALDVVDWALVRHQNPQFDSIGFQLRYSITKLWYTIYDILNT